MLASAVMSGATPSSTLEKITVGCVPAPGAENKVRNNKDNLKILQRCLTRETHPIAGIKRTAALFYRTLSA